MIRKLNLISSGCYLPSHIRCSSFYDEIFQLQPGTISQKLKINQRHIATQESVIDMGKSAIESAMLGARLTVNDIDCLISACGVMHQAIPTNSVLIQNALGWQKSGICCFDVNSTCLSFLSALELISYAIHLKQYNNAVIVSSEKPSQGIDLFEKQTSPLFGDGAVAWIIGHSSIDSSEILGSNFQTFAYNPENCHIKAGGTGYKIEALEEAISNHQFKMNGKEIFKQARKVVPEFVKKLLSDSRCQSDDVNWVIPHQASATALKYVLKHLPWSTDNFLYELDKLGNQMSVSIPITLHKNITAGIIKKGDIVLLLGTAPGLSVGGILIRI